jgi:hypothetical protein
MKRIGNAMAIRTAALALVLAGTLCATPVAARTIALLVGIGQTDAVGVTDSAARAKLMLEGPPLDVAAMRRVVEDRMGARPEDVHVLIDHQASRAAILAELRALLVRSQPGDTVVIFYSGHGTSQRDPESRTGLPQGTSAWIPADFDFGNPDNVAARLISGRLDIRPVALEPLDRGGRNVIIISDSCFSGNIVRGVGTENDGVISKYVPLGDGAGVPDGLKAADFTPPTYPYAHVLMLSASADTERATDLARERARLTVDGKPKGALTNALLRVFGGLTPADYNRDGKVSFDELQRAVREDLAGLGLMQSPQLLPALDQDPAGIRYGPVPGMAAIAVTDRASRLSVAIPADAAALVTALRESGDFDLVTGHADLAVSRGSGGDRFTLANGAGDPVARDVLLEAIVARLHAGAWARQVVAGGGAPIALAADTQPSARGGNFVIGRDSLQLAVKSDRPAWYLVVDIDPKGRLITLWPTTAEENRAAPADTVQTFGQTAATDPEGLDHVVVLAFEHAPNGIDAWYKLGADFGTAEANGLVKWLTWPGRPYAATTIDVRTIRACQTGGSGSCGH